MRVTIVDVAKKAGVSNSTVSKVLNNTPYVSEKAKDSVLKAMVELDYIPNSIARNLVKNRNTPIIGLIVSDILNPFYPEFVRGVEDTARIKNYSMVLCNTDYDLRKEENYINFLLQIRASGIIFASTRIHDSIIYELKKLKYPFILLGRIHPIIETDFVEVDNELGATIAVKYLISKGHKKIAHITGPLDTSPALARLNGYKNALKENGIEYDEDLVMKGDFRESSGYESAKKLLIINRKKRPTAIFAANDLSAMGAMEAIYSLGLKVPDNISIIGFDNIHISSYPSINLTTINQPKYEMAKIATEILIAKSENKIPPKKKRQVVLEPSLVERKTVQEI